MQVDVHVEGDTVSELEANARTELDRIADGRPYDFKVEHAHASAREDFPTPVARMSAGYSSRKRLSGYVSATFGTKASS